MQLRFRASGIRMPVCTPVCICLRIDSESNEFDDRRCMAELELQQMHARSIIARGWRRIHVIVKQRLHVRA